MVIGTVFKTFGASYMDVTLRLGASHAVRIVERPGLWMDEAALAALSADLRHIAARTLDTGGLTYGVFSGEKAAMEAAIVTLVARSDGTPVAFNALAVLELDTVPHPTDVLHLGLVMVDPEERSKNLSWVLYGMTCFLIFFRRQFRPIWVSNVTQVPAVVGMVSEMFSDVWPRPEQGRRRLNHVLLAREIMATQRHVFGVGGDAVFDEESFVIANAYTGGSEALKKTWEASPKHRDDSYNRFCQQALNYERGDDVLQLGRMDLAAMRGYLLREVPKSALIGLVMTGALVALRRIVLPVLRWADSSRRWSILRPRTGRDA